jgi:hypothetical protein
MLIAGQAAAQRLQGVAAEDAVVAEAVGGLKRLQLAPRAA